MSKEVRLLTDQATYDIRVGKTFSAHASVNHSREEYVSKVDPSVHTNTVEGFYFIVYVPCAVSISTAASSTYTATWPSSTSATAHARPTGRTTPQAEKALKGVVGTRLTYRRTDKPPQA